MYLIGDIGNTEIKICLVNNRFNILKRYHFGTDEIKSKNLNKLFNRNLNVDYALFSSVVPKVYSKFIKFFRKKGVSCNEIKKIDLKKMIKLKVDKNQVGSDRVANAISAIDNKNNFIIIDFGTATTFDVITKNIYHGGIIAPGVNLSLNTLISKASLIPKINLKKVKKVIGKNTKSAVRSGFFWGYNGLIENIIKLISKETKKNFKIIFTGGLSHLFKNLKSVKDCTIDKDLTINGLIRVIKKKHEK